MIKVLDKSVSELIAAGEVIERPASVVKELIENSIDAGAKSITVEIKNGGISFLRISDDGVGIPYEQCPTAFLRHATSKVSNSADLAAIATLGFRGEALASVAAVSKVSLLTKTAEQKRETKSQNFGTCYKIEGGAEIEHAQAGCPDGTTIIIRDLFFNTPARLKFLKKDVSEGNFVQSTVDKAALINPHIAFRFIRDNKLVRVTPGDGKMYSAIYAVYGKSVAASMVEVDCSQNGVSVNGYVSLPLFCKSNRAFQNFYVNSRYVKSQTCSAALEEAYRNNIMTGKFPACVLNIVTDPADVDANVHPAKTEVRFVNDRSIFSAVHIAVKNALLNTDAQNSTETLLHEPKVVELVKSAAVSLPETITFDSGKTLYNVMPPKPAPVVVEYKYISPESLIKKESDKKSPLNENVLIETKNEQIRVIGELFSTYIVCEREGDLVLIDKHAADERIRFNELKQQLKAHSQLLIEPIAVHLDVESCGGLLGAKEELAQIGLDVEPAENGVVRVMAMPSVIDNSHIEELLLSVARLLKTGGELRFAELNITDEIMHKLACRAAIKAGDKSTACDIEQLAQKVSQDSSLRYCPHGRPIMVRITKRDLEKMFKRII